MRAATNKKKKSELSFFAVFILWFYTLAIITKFMFYTEEYGQKTPQKFAANYMYPFTRIYALVFLFVTAIPLGVLYFMKIPYERYPVTKNVRGKFTWMSLFYHCLNILASPAAIYSIVGPFYYVLARYYGEGYTASILENVLGVGYLISYIFSYQLWLTFVTDYYFGILDTITMWTFAVQQVQRSRSSSQV